MFNSLLPQTWDKVHHAYILSGVEADSVWKELSNLGFLKRGNADAKYEEFETLGVDEARALTDWALMKPIAGDRKVAVIDITSTFTTEAQNALLKLFEEPPQGTYFFLILPNTASVLSTLLSRVRIIQKEKESEINKKYEVFMPGTVAERFKIITPIIKSKDKERAREFIRFLESKTTNIEAEKVIEAEKYLSSRGASMKMILEYLAVSL
ncbi:MAG TPA: hypothetical protein VJH67_01255 [Candidatus Paceibacterota bacterium]